MNSRFSLLVSSLTISTTLFLSQTVLADFSQPKKIGAEFGSLYIPDGFDTNDNVQIVGEGVFPNLCYRPGVVRVAIDSVKKIVKLMPRALHYSGPCLQVILPWDRVVDIGVMSAGDYTVVQASQNAENRVIGQLRIPIAKTQSADDYLYAPISQAYYEKKDSHQTLKISGEFSNDCTKLVNVAVKVQRNVIVVQPISEMDVNAQCKPGKFAFEKTTDLPKVPSGRYLIHVRSLNGKSINTLVDVD